MFSVHTKTQSQCFQILTGLKTVFEKLCFRDGLVWTLGLIAEIELRSNFSSVVWAAPYSKGPNIITLSFMLFVKQRQITKKYPALAD